MPGTEPGAGSADPRTALLQDPLQHMPRSRGRALCTCSSGWAEPLQRFKTTLRHCQPSGSGTTALHGTGTCRRAPLCRGTSVQQDPAPMLHWVGGFARWAGCCSPRATLCQGRKHTEPLLQLSACIQRPDGPSAPSCTPAPRVPMAGGCPCSPRHYGMSGTLPQSSWHRAAQWEVFPQTRSQLMLTPQGWAVLSLPVCST